MEKCEYGVTCNVAKCERTIIFPRNQVGNIRHTRSLLGDGCWKVKQCRGLILYCMHYNQHLLVFVLLGVLSATVKQTAPIIQLIGSNKSTLQ